MKILAIETSCDETAVAIVEDGYKLLSSVVASSMSLHVQYGGVIPEIAARSHLEVMVPVLDQAISKAKLKWNDIDGIAVTYGAGLSGSLLIGVMTAKTLALVKQKPLYAINHVEGHVYANFITSTPLKDYSLPDKQPDFPMLAIIVSGNHTQLVLFDHHFKYRLLGQTHDDAIGEAFDKVAKILGLPYPGGPSVEQAARKGNPDSYQLPKARMEGKYDFSFSGLKTAVLRLSQAMIGEDYSFPSFKLSEHLNESQKINIAASFTKTAVETVVDKAVMAYNEFRPASIVVGGGVATSPELRHCLNSKRLANTIYPDPKLCTDNGAMIAALGCFKAKYQPDSAANPYDLTIDPSLSM